MRQGQRDKKKHHPSHHTSHARVVDMGGFTTWGVQAAPLGASLLVQDHAGNMQDQPGNSGLTAWVVLAN